MPVWKQLVLIALLAAGGFAAWTALSPQGSTSLAALFESGSEPARGGRRGGGRRGAEARVITATVQEATTGDTLRAIGTGRAVQAVTLYPRATGLVAEIAFRAGDAVAPGAVLLRLDDEEEAIAVEQARIALQTAQDTVARYERLANSQAVAQVQLEESRAALATARNALSAAELAFARRNVVAPFAGVMGLAEVSIGDMVSATTPIANIDDRSTLLVEFSVPERYAALVARGREIAVSTPAYGTEQFAGVIEALDSRLDPVSRSLAVRAHLANADDRLKPGMSFAVELGFEGETHPAVPAMAVQWDRNGSYVWQVVDGLAARVAVEIVERRGEIVLVRGDLAAADTVVAEGVQTLRPGAEVTIAGEAPMPVAALDAPPALSPPVTERGAASEMPVPAVPSAPAQGGMPLPRAAPATL